MKRALVTGGSGDIGQAICSRLSDEGMFVYVHSFRNLEKARQIAEEIRSKGGSAQAVSFDLTNREETENGIESILEEGEIQVLVNNAGFHEDAVMAGMKPEQWYSVIDVCLNGFYHVTQPVLLPMIKTRWGRIINISSISGVIGNRGQANYAAAKAGLIGATKSMSLEMSSRGITTNAIAPGLIEGAMTKGLFDKDTINKMVPMRRAGTPKEVASLVAFLASEDASYISGQVIGINGGMA